MICIKTNKKTSCEESPPSCASNWARFERRRIVRARRRAVKESLQFLTPEDDWDDSYACGRFDHRMSKLRSSECWRISKRRAADKLGPLYRWTKHQQRTSENDEEAYEKACQVLQPHKNLITRHAAEHIRNILELKEDEFKYQWRRHKPGPKILSGNQLMHILEVLFETNHKALNRAAKDHGLILGHCKKDDPCQETYERKSPKHEYYDILNKKWIEYYWTNSRRVRNAGYKTRTRWCIRTYKYHDIYKCPNRVIITQKEDLDTMFRAIRGWHMDKEFFQNLKKHCALRKVLVAAKRLNLLPLKVEEVL